MGLHNKKHGYYKLKENIMELLEQKIQDKIYELENSAEEKLEQNNLSATMECMDKAWELYPEPKTNWTEA
jgi:hypothetical protein